MYQKNGEGQLYVQYFKDGDKLDCKNYRGIALLPQIGKIYERILEQRLRICVEKELGEWQYGFRPGRSTMDLIFTLKIMLEKAWEWDIDMFTVFLDLEKAFDRIQRGKLWRILGEEEYNVNTQLKKAIISLYDNCESRVGEGTWFKVSSGVRQGSVLSPLLFIIYMDKIVKEIQKGYEGYQRHIETLSYADDVAMVSRNKVYLQKAVDEWVNQLKNYDMKLNTRKSKVMVLSRQRNNCEIYVEGNKLEEVNNFKYLGVNYNNAGQMQVEIDKRIAKYSKNLGLLYPLIKEKHIPEKVKIQIYTTILKPILLYGSESWVLTTKMKSKLQAAEMRTLRLIKRVTRLDKQRNEDIRKSLKVESLLNNIEKNQLRWFGHVQRMDNSRYPKKYYNWKPSGKRPPGRPRKRYQNNIEEALHNRGKNLQMVNDTRLFDDRSTWKKFIHSGAADRR